ncbi:MAG: hypothetical protein NTZ94_15770 [Verrucomicrobia bacterium]|nr:hypothetical protein [Verrucomicrobiota bacterium]
MDLIEAPYAGFSLDLDSTVFSREGNQEGVAKGYNPRRPGRKTHHPILEVLVEMTFVLHAWLRAGNTGAGRGVFTKGTRAVASGNEDKVRESG